jgi:hypothetical protein
MLFNMCLVVEKKAPGKWLGVKKTKTTMNLQLSRFVDLWGLQVIIGH